MGIAIFNEEVPEDVLSEAEKNIIKNYAISLARETEDAAGRLYFINKFIGLKNKKFKNWCDAALDFLGTRSKCDFIEAIYGYAVEEYVNMGIAAGILSVPRGFSVKIQETHGHTRPDIVIEREGGSGVAWLDITNKRSEGHINRKDGNWGDDRKFIAELLYPDFDASKINTGCGSIASGIAARSIIRQAGGRERCLMRHMAQKMDGVFCELTAHKRRGKAIAQPAVAECIQRHFGVIFGSNYKHPIIKSMLQLYIGYGDANRRADARNCLNGLYRNEGQDKSAALSYIEKSCNSLDPYRYN